MELLFKFNVQCSWAVVYDLGYQRYVPWIIVIHTLYTCYAYSFFSFSKGRIFQDCINTVGDYSCECVEGTERGQDGSCQTIPQECDIKAARSRIKAMSGTNVAVKV